MKKKEIDASNLTLTGSSLGGALAAYAGSKMAIKTITFNAAGVHPDNVGPHIDMVTNYFLWGEFLTKMQEKRPWLPRAIGTQIRVNPAPGDANLGGIDRHFIEPMQRALEWWGM